jgi:hypothetical protein
MRTILDYYWVAGERYNWEEIPELHEMLDC